MKQKNIADTEEGVLFAVKNGLFSNKAKEQSRNERVVLFVEEMLPDLRALEKKGEISVKYFPSCMWKIAVPGVITFDFYPKSGKAMICGDPPEWVDYGLDLIHENVFS